MAEPLDVLAALRTLRCVDLTWPLHAAMPVYPGRIVQPFERVATVNLAEHGVNSGRYALTEHTGTHLDAPVHFIDGQISAERIPVGDLVAEAVLVDIADVVRSDPEYRLGVADLEAWEARHGRLPDGAFLLVRSGWGARWHDPAAYLNRDADGVLRYPAVSPPAASLLVERGILGVGVDTLSVDNAAPSDVRSPSHKVLHGAGRYVIENLANLEALPEQGILLFVGALPIVGATAGTARVLAFVA